MLAGFLAVLCLAAAVVLVAGWVWAVRRFDFKPWAALLSGLLVAPFAASFIFLAGLLTVL